MSSATASGSLYELIGVDRRATRAEIEAACLRTAAANLPENNPDDPTAAVTYRQVERAFEVLGDPVRRATYDRGLPLEAAAVVEAAAIPVAPVPDEAPVEQHASVEDDPTVPEDTPIDEVAPVELVAPRKPSLTRAMGAGFVSGALVAAIAVVCVLGYEAATKGPNTPAVYDRHQAAAPRIPS